MDSRKILNVRHLLAFLILLAFAGIGLLVAGCTTTQSQQPPTPQSTAIATTHIEASESLVPIMTDATHPEPTLTPDTQGPTAQKYLAKLAEYQLDLPADTAPTTLASLTVQQKLVDDMIALYTQKAPSKAIHTLYLQGITQLAPEAADTFTAYAISGMRRNSFEDYQMLEQFANTQGSLDRFFKIAEPYEFNYLQLNRHVDAIHDPTIKALVVTAQDQGYYIASAEGMLYYLVDFSVFAQYRQSNTASMADLILSLAIDSLDPLSSDAARIVEPWVLAARTYGIERMLADYQGSPYEKYVASRFRDHLVMLLFGLNNTPNFSYETGLITPEAQALFTELQTLEGSQIAMLTTQLQAVLAANGGKLNDTNREQAMALLNGVDKQYNLSETDLEQYGLWMSGQIDHMQIKQ
ncbi:MAG: hypothetical protein PHC86_02065 [Eubacteriales bacterium]|nr:hypothetical protein [Eubacteriales bacterium]